MTYSIGARPTLELFFTTEQGHTFCVDLDGELSPAPDEDLSMLRWAVMGETDLNADAKWAVELAQSHARDNGWTLNDEIYFN